MNRILKKSRNAVPPMNENALAIAIEALSQALITTDASVVGIVRDDKKKIQIPSIEKRKKIQELIAVAYWIMEDGDIAEDQ